MNPKSEVNGNRKIPEYFETSARADLWYLCIREARPRLPVSYRQIASAFPCNPGVTGERFHDSRRRWRNKKPKRRAARPYDRNSNLN